MSGFALVLKVLGQFQADLKTLEGEISDRNRHRFDAYRIDYPYLLLLGIPNSINI
jgi:hypothetical protein